VRQRRPANPERSFGISVGVVLCAIALYSAWRGRAGRVEIFGGIGVCLFASGLLYPSILKWPSALWWSVARLLGYAMARSGSPCCL
jgi:hypothetical protein